VFDRWIAVRVGSELRQVESSLSEEGEAEEDVIKRLQVGRRRRDAVILLQGRDSGQPWREGQGSDNASCSN
jgi:hypothetical protein